MDAVLSFNAQPIIRQNGREMWANERKMLVIDSSTKELLRLYPIEDINDEVLEFELS